MLIVVGEGMLELAGAAPNWTLGYGGDTLNSAIHLARLGQAIAFATALGTDPFSDSLRRDWSGEGLDLSLVRTDPTRRPALYAITTDDAGERSFTYWRNDSAARRMFALGDNSDLRDAAATAPLLYFSMITLAILPEEGRRELFALCDQVRAHGGRVAFDSNYRPALWESLDAALGAYRRAIAACDIGLPTFDDERALTGLDDPAEVVATWQALGATELVVKLGGDGCLAEGIVYPVPARISPLDTTGAGDAFNAGYLHARLSGRSIADSVAAGHMLAGWAITQRGGIPAPTPDAPYAALR